MISWYFFMQRLKKNKANWSQTIAKGKTARFVPVVFHLVGDNDGNQRLSEESAYKAICVLNERFAILGLDICLYIKKFEEINNSIIHQTPAGSPLPSFKDPRAMNIFCVGDISSGSGGTTLGYYQPGSFFDFIVIRNDQVGNEDWTLEHEVGHFFSLAHTHRGWEDEPWTPQDYDEKITAVSIQSSQVNGSALIELVDRSNCEGAGDMLCDTQSDYGRGQSCNCCTLSDVIMDRNCDTLRPMMNNIMSYSARCFDWQFTGDQVLAMHTDFDSPERFYLRNDDVTVHTPIIEVVEPTYPIGLEVVDVYDNITLTWNPVSNSEFYRVYVGDDVYRTTETSLTVTNLAPDKLVQWRVNAFGKFGTGCLEVQAQGFFTGSQEYSAVTDLSFVESLSFYPNPVSSAEDIKLAFDSNKSFTTDLSIYNISGKVVYKQRGISFASGNNIQAIPTVGFDTGIYIIELKTAEGTITEKIIVE